MNKPISRLFIFIIIVVGIGIGFLSLSRPDVVGMDGVETVFSAERALEHVEAISTAPHPPGSEKIDFVRDYILGQLDILGISYEIHDTTIAVPQGSSVIASSIKNIIAIIPGEYPSKAILLDAHYDTRAMSPGASDCGSCVATLLETARAIMAGPTLQNDVILLFTDNEEYGGGLGAAAFLNDHHLSDDIGLVLNFEGIGSTGPVLLFETGPASGWAVKGWGKAVSHPVGQSWFNEIYQLTPLNTDMSWFNDAGIPGMNFAFISKGTVYHAITDNTGSIDPQSLQHHGSYALDLVNYFGNQELNTRPTPKGNPVYFTLFPGLLISYSAGWALSITILTGIALIGVFTLGIRTNQLSIKGTLKGLGGFTLSLVASSGLATGIWMGINQIQREYLAMFTFRGLFYNAHFYFIAFAALAVAIAAAIVIWLRRKTSLLDLHFGALGLFWLLAMASSILMPGFSYLLTWPLVFCLIGLGWVILKQPKNPVIPLMISALPGMILIVPSIYVMFHFILAPMIGILAFFISLILGLLIPQISSFTEDHKWRLSGFAMLICVMFLIVGSMTTGYSPDQPRPNAVAYLLNSDTGEATWFSAGYLQDEWTEQFFTDQPEIIGVGELFPLPQGSGFPVMHGSAPTSTLEPPRAEIISDEVIGDVRLVTVHLSSPRGAEVVMMDVQPYSAVIAATVGGERLETVESSRDLWSLTYYAVPTNGFEITIELDPNADVQVQVSDQTWDLNPEVLELLDDYQPRSADMMPMPNFDYGVLVVGLIDL